MRIRGRRSFAAIVLALSLAVSAGAQNPQHQQTPAKPSADMSGRCKAMMSEHDKMMAKMKTTISGSTISSGQ